MAPTLDHQRRHNFVEADLTESHCDAIAVPVQGNCLIDKADCEALVQPFGPSFGFFSSFWLWPGPNLCN